MNKTAYPLGLFTEEYYKSEASYAEDQLQYFDRNSNG